MKQSQRKSIKPQEAYNKREYNHQQHHQEREEASKNRTTEESEAFFAVPSCHTFFQGCWQVGKTIKTNNIISPKATHQKASFSSISQNNKQTVKARFKNGQKEETVNNFFATTKEIINFENL